MRNGKIDIYKFLFAVALAVGHYDNCLYSNSLWRNTWIVVEFFFIVSGFYFAKALTKCNDEPFTAGVRYTLKRYASIFLYHLFAVIIAIAYELHIGGYTLCDALEYIAQRVPHILLIQDLGFTRVDAMRQEWYISAMLIVMLVLSPFVIKYKDKFTGWFAPLAVLFIFAYLANFPGTETLSVVNTRNSVVCLGILRAFADICLGCVVYAVHKSEVLNRCPGTLLLVFEVCAFGCAAVYIIFGSHTSAGTECTMTFVIAAAVSLAMCGKSEIPALNNRVSSYLGKLSLTLYLNHYYVLTFMSNRANIGEWSYGVSMAIYLGISLAMSVLCLAVVDFGKKKVKRINPAEVSSERTNR